MNARPTTGDPDPNDDAGMAAYVESLFPAQQQAIATAQLAGCRFERRSVERNLGKSRDEWAGQRWITTTEYVAFLPEGTEVGTFEDIYEGALKCLSILDPPHGAPRRAETAAGAFALLPENEV